MPIPHPTFGSDMIWFWNRTTQQASPVMYYSTTTDTWTFDTGAAVPDNYIQPDHALLFFSGRSSNEVSTTIEAVPNRWSLPTINITP